MEMQASFAEAMTEFQAEGRGRGHDRSMVGNEIRDGRWADAATFGAFLADLKTVQARVVLVPSTTWWWCEGDTYLGRIAVRHKLTDKLRKIGGPSATTCGRRPGARATARRCWRPRCRVPGRWASSPR